MEKLPNREKHEIIRFTKTGHMAQPNYKKFFDLEAIIRSVREYLPNLDVKRFKKAFSFAEEAHRGQIRRDGKTPYIAHPVETVKILITMHADEDTLISAFLHDVPEDTKRDIHEIKIEFGEKVAFLVEGITKLSKVHYIHNMPERQIESLKKMLLHSVEDLRVVIIKLADRLHNMQTLGNIEEAEKRSRIATETLEIYVPMANLLGIRDVKNQLEDLCFKHLFPVEYKKVKARLDSFAKHQDSNIDRFTERIRKGLQGKNIEIAVSKKNKNLYSVYKKVCSLGKGIDGIDERVVVKIVVENVEQCYQVLGVVHGEFVPKTDRFKDYIANPKMNGYQSIHTTVFGVDGVVTEVQIRTKKMDIDGEYGIAANFFENKVNGHFSADLQKSSWLKKVLEIEREGNDSDSFLEELKLDVFHDRIFVFTPKGEPVDLPEGACVIDFAYAIHSDLGNHACKAMINGQLRSIATVLKTGNVVNVVTSKKTEPELTWLSFVKTNVAKNKIVSYLKKAKYEKKVKIGHEILQREFDIAGFGLCKKISFRKLQSQVTDTLGKSFKSLEELCVAIAEGELKAIDVVKALEKGGTKDFQPEGTKLYIKIVAKNRFGLMRDITEVLYKHAVDMYTFKGAASHSDEDAYFSAKLLIKDVHRVREVFDELEQIDEVKHVYRMSTRGLWIFWSYLVAIILTWISHPILIGALEDSGFGVRHHLAISILVYAGFFLVFMMLFYVTNILKKYFPVVRNKKLLTFSIFVFPLLALFLIYVESKLLNFKLNWEILLMEAVAVYAYLSVHIMSVHKSMKKIGSA